MFDLKQYITSLDVKQDDELLVEAKDLTTAVHLICNDPWLSRQAFYGLAGSMERQLTYLGTNLLPNAERKLQQLASSGVMGESYVVNNWFGNTNEDDNHINSETVMSHTGEQISADQQLDDQQTFVEELHDRMRRACIIMVVAIREHDRISDNLDQLSYAAIAARAAMNRTKRTA